MSNFILQGGRCCVGCVFGLLNCCVAVWGMGYAFQFGLGVGFVAFAVFRGKVVGLARFQGV